MRFFGFAVLLLALVATPCSYGQNPGAAPTRDPDAVLAIRQAIMAMGGEGTVALIRDAVTQGEFEEEWAGSTIKCTFIWKNAGKEFRYETTRNGETQVFVSDGGNPRVRAGGNTTRLNGHTTMYHIPPHLAAWALLDRLRAGRMSVALLEPTSASGKQVIRVLVHEKGDAVVEKISNQVWSFDATTGLPLQVEYELPDDTNANRTVSVRDEFSDFRNISGVVVPFRIVSRVGMTRPKTIRITAVTLNAGIGANDFRLQ